MKRSCPVLALLFAVTIAGGASAREPGPHDLLPVGEQAVLPAPPSTVADSAERGSWSSDGKYVLAWRNAIQLPFDLMGEPGIDSSLWLWSQQTGKSREIWQSRIPRHQSGPLGWLYGTSIALTTVDVAAAQPDPANPKKTDRWIARIDARAGTVKLTARVNEHASLVIAPRTSFAVAQDVEGRQRLIKSDGLLGAAIALPNGDSPAAPFWAADGTTLLIGTAALGENDALVGTIFAYEPRTGKMRPVESPVLVWKDPEPKGAVRLLHSRGDLRDGVNAVPLRPLWLTAQNGDRLARTLLAPDADWAKLSPTGDAVAYTQEGALMVRRFVSYPRAAVEKALEAALRTTVVSDCRQIGLALHIYAQNNGDALPSQDQAVDAALMKYLKNERPFEGFVYTYPGGKLTDIAKPAETILGYKLGPGGRANVFADGHVVWEADQ